LRHLTLAKQNFNPPKWHVGLSDGCSAPWGLRWLFNSKLLKYCHRHDERYHYGGTWSDKLYADDEFYWNIYHSGWWGRRLAGTIYWNIRTYTYNFPVGHPNRSWRSLTKGKAFNFLGPGLPKNGPLRYALVGDKTPLGRGTTREHREALVGALKRLTGQKKS